MSLEDQYKPYLEQGGDGEPVPANSFVQVGAAAGAPVDGVPLYYFCITEDLDAETVALATYVTNTLRGNVLTKPQLKTLMKFKNQTFNLIIDAHGNANDPALYMKHNNPAQFTMTWGGIRKAFTRDDIIEVLNREGNIVTIYPCICENLQGVQSTSRGTVLWEGFSCRGVNNKDFKAYMRLRGVMGIN